MANNSFQDADAHMETAGDFDDASFEARMAEFLRELPDDDDEIMRQENMRLAALNNEQEPREPFPADSYSAGDLPRASSPAETQFGPDDVPRDRLEQAEAEMREERMWREIIEDCVDDEAFYPDRPMDVVPYPPQPNFDSPWPTDSSSSTIPATEDQPLDNSDDGQDPYYYQPNFDLPSPTPRSMSNIPTTEGPQLVIANGSAYQQPVWSPSPSPYMPIKVQPRAPSARGPPEGLPLSKCIWKYPPGAKGRKNHIFYPERTKMREVMFAESELQAQGRCEAVVDEELLAEDPTDNADDEPVSKKICRRSR